MKTYEITLQTYNEMLNENFEKGNKALVNIYYGQIVGYLECLKDMSIINQYQYSELKEKYTN
jgi:hypothetical protein